jgi:tetratricopeptide (TPR) repeat protein
LAGGLISYVELDKRIFEKQSAVLFKILGIIAAIAVVIFYGLFSINAIRADYYFKQAKSFAAKGDLEKTVENFELAQKVLPLISEYFEGHADFLFEFGIRMPKEMQATYLIDAADKYVEAKIVGPDTPSLLANMGLVQSRLAVIHKNNEAKRNKYVGMAQGFMLHAKTIAKNNPLYHYKCAQMHEYLEEYGQAYDYYNETLEIRDPYKDTAEKILLMRELEPKIAEGEAEKAARENNSEVIQLNEDLLPPEEASNESSDGDSEE